MPDFNGQFEKGQENCNDMSEKEETCVCNAIAMRCQKNAKRGGNAVSYILQIVWGLQKGGEHFSGKCTKL